MKSKIVLMFLLLIIMPDIILAQRTQPSFSKHLLTDVLQKPKKLYPIDLDNDEDIDVVAVASNVNSDTANVLWFENDGNKNFTTRVVSDTFYTARSVWVADIVGNDGYPEILAGGEGIKPLIMYINDGSPVDGGWERRTIGVADCTIYSINASDFDEDGNIDILATYGNEDTDDGGDKIRLFMNNGDTTFVIDTLVSAYEGACSVFIDDFNNDDNWDILSCAFGEDDLPLYGDNDNISWWSNDGSENFTQNDLNIPLTFQCPFFVSSADINGDGYSDILGAAYLGGFTPGDPLGAGSLSWWENSGGSFGSEQSIVTDFSFSRSIHGKDIDGDGDTDILGTADRDDVISWFENDGNQSFTRSDIATNFSHAYFAYPIDLDGDGDIDIIGSAQDDYEVSWWENQQDEDSLIASGNPEAVIFWDGDVVIDFSDGSEDSVTVFYNAGDVPDRTSLGSGIDHLATKGFYTITTRKTSYTASVDFYYGDDNVDEWSAITLGQEDELVICIWDETNGYWEVAGTSQTVDSGDDSITVNGISSEFSDFSKWTIGSTTSDNPLPVQLLAFNVQSELGKVKLSWKTASELNNLGFEIWRYEDDQFNYRKIAGYKTDKELEGHVSTTLTTNYEFYDTNIKENTNYSYELYQIDFSGRRELLDVVSVKTSESLLPTSLVLKQNYPNPFNPSTTIEYNVPENPSGSHREIQLNIYDIRGSLVKNLVSGQHEQGIFRVKWDGTNTNGKLVSSGFYMVVLSDGSTVHSRKLVLQR